MQRDREKGMITITRCCRPLEEGEHKRVRTKSADRMRDPYAKEHLVISLVYALTHGYYASKTHHGYLEKGNGRVPWLDLDKLVDGVKNDATEHARQQLQALLVSAQYKLAGRMFFTGNGETLDQAILEYIRLNRENIY